MHLAARHWITLPVFFLVLFLGYQFDWQYQYSRYQKAKQHSQELEQEITDIQNFVTQSPQQQTLLTNTQQSFSRVLATLPKSLPLDEVLTALTALGNSAHVQWSTVQAAPTQTRNFYRVTPIQITLTGTYQELLNFMQDTINMEKVPALLTWDNFTLMRQQPAATTVNLSDKQQDILLMQATVMAYDFAPH